MTAHGRESGSGRPFGRRAWVLPLVAFVGRRVWLYVALYALHLTVAGIALALVAIKAGTGDSDWIFWLCYGWIALQVLTGPFLFLPTALALTVVAVQATQADRDGWFWLAFAWLSLMILRGGVILRAARLGRRRARGREGEEASSGPEAVFAAMFAGRGFSWSQAGGEPPGEGDVVEGSAHEVSPDLVAELERLASLHESGSITSEEYERAKDRLLD